MRMLLLAICLCVCVFCIFRARESVAVREVSAVYEMCPWTFAANH